MVIKESTLVYAEAVSPDHVSTWAEAATENETTNLGSGETEVCKRNRTAREHRFETPTSPSGEPAQPWRG